LHQHGPKLQVNFRLDWCLLPCNKLTPAACVAEEALHSIAQLRAIVQQASAGVTAEAVAVRDTLVDQPIASLRNDGTISCRLATSQVGIASDSLPSRPGLNQQLSIP
jgi:hypothetical protein